MSSTASLAVDSANRASASKSNLVPPTTPPVAPNSIASALGAIVKLVPTDIVGMYVVVLTALQSQKEIAGNTYWLWGWLAVSFLLTIVFFYLQFALSYKRKEGALPSLRSIPAWRITLTLIAFVVWALAVQPDATRIMFGGGETGNLMKFLATLSIVVIGPLLTAIDSFLNPSD